LVFSTLHTNSAVGAIARLRDMGVEPFLLASTLNGILAQRLVRVLCIECREPRIANRAECEMLGVDPAQPPVIHDAHGCPACNGSGYRGRTGIYELIEIDDALRQMIHEGAGERALTEHVRGITPGIRSDGVRRVLDGTTSVEEVVRVTRED
jgi:general secretion pathway protein E